MLISAELFFCGIVTLLRSLGATQWFGIRMPVLMLTMTLVMIVVTIESTGMFLAIGDMTSKKSTEKCWQLACAPTACADCAKL